MVYDIELIKKVNKEFNKRLRNKIKIISNTNHIFERLKERNLHIIDYQKILYKFSSHHLCLFLYYTFLSDNQKPYKINLKNDDIIVVLGRRDDDWVISTVLDPKRHNKHDDEKTGTFEITLNV